MPAPPARAAALVLLAWAAGGAGADRRITPADPAAPRRLAAAGPSSWADCLAVSADGRRVAAGELVWGRVTVWDAGSGAVVHTLLGPRGHVLALAFSPDGRTLAVAALADIVNAHPLSEVPEQPDRPLARVRADLRLWDLTTGRELRAFAPGGPVTSLGFAPDGRALLAGGADGTVRVWAVPGGEEVKSFPAHAGWVLSLLPGRDAGTCLTAGMDGRVRGWDYRTGKKLREVAAPAPVQVLAASPDGTRVAGGDRRGGVSVWDADGKPLYAVDGHGKQRVRAVGFTPDSARLVVAGNETAGVRDAADGKLLYPVPTRDGFPEGTNLADPTTEIKAAGVDAGGRLVTSQAQVGVRAWPAGAKEAPVAFRWPGPPRHVLLSADGGRLLTSSGKDVYVWDFATGKELRRMEWAGVTGMALSADGKRLAVRSAGAVRVVDPEGGQVLRDLSDPKDLAAADPADARLVREASGQVFAAGGAAAWRTFPLTPDAFVVARVDAAGKVEARIDTQGYGEKVRGWDFAADGGRLATGGSDGTARVWDVKTRKEVLRVDTGLPLVTAVGVTAGGKHLLTVGEKEPAKFGDPRVRTFAVWDAATGKPVRTFAETPGTTVEASWDSLARVLLTRRVGDAKDAEWETVVWDVDAGKALRARRSKDVNRRAAFSGDGRTVHVVRAEKDGVAAAGWDVATGEERFALTVPAVGGRAGLSPDGRRLVSEEADGAGRVLVFREPATGKVVHRLPVAAGTGGLRFSPGGTWVAFQEGDEAVVCDLETGRPTVRVPDLLSHAVGETALAASYFVPGGATRYACWDVRTGRPLAELTANDFFDTGHAVGLASFAVSPDGRWLLTGGSDRTARLWDAGSGAQAAVLRGHHDRVTAVAFSADGRRVVTGGSDGAVRVWDRETGAERHRLRAGRTVGHVGFTPDGGSILAADANGVLVFPLPK